MTHSTRRDRARRGRRCVAAAALAATVMATAACGTAEEYQVDLVEGTHAEFEVGDVLFRGVLLIADDDKPERAMLVATVLNESATKDVLQSVSLGPAASAVTVQTDVDLPPDVPVRLGPTGTVQIVLPDPGKVYRVGGFVPLTLRLRDAGHVSHTVIVEDARDYLEPVPDVELIPSPGPSTSRPPAPA